MKLKPIKLQWNLNHSTQEHYYTLDFPSLTSSTQFPAMTFSLLGLSVLKLMVLVDLFPAHQAENEKVFNIA